jgi:hypothetical protein
MTDHAFPDLPFTMNQKWSDNKGRKRGHIVDDAQHATYLYILNAMEIEQSSKSFILKETVLINIILTFLKRK